jgi:hypothetical protein
MFKGDANDQIPISSANDMVASLPQVFASTTSHYKVASIIDQ